MLEASVALALAPRPTPARRGVIPGRFMLSNRLDTSLAEA